jgi:DNA-binding beta-propeller fold protein YncE
MRDVGEYATDVRIDRDGNVVVVGAGGFLDKLDPTGKPLKSQEIGILAQALTYDRQDRAWIPDWYDGVVDIYDPDWKRVKEIAVGEHPKGVQFDSGGNAWVIHYSHVSKISEAGEVLATYPVDPGPLRLAIDAHDNVWVLCHGVPSPEGGDGWSPTVVKLAPDGSRLETLQMDVDDLAFDAAGDVWVVNDSPGFVAKLNADGEVLLRHEAHGWANSPYRGWRVAIDPKGQVWIAESGVLYQVTSDGEYLRAYRYAGYAYGIAFDRDGNVWLADNEYGTVVRVVPQRP